MSPVPPHDFLFAIDATRAAAASSTLRLATAVFAGVALGPAPTHSAFVGVEASTAFELVGGAQLGTCVNDTSLSALGAGEASRTARSPCDGGVVRITGWLRWLTNSGVAPLSII